MTGQSKSKLVDKAKELNIETYKVAGSQDSYSFCNVENFKCDALIRAFKIKNTDVFNRKFSQAINGDGEEIHRITRLHSSSLLSLLTFYDIENHSDELEFDYLNIKEIPFKNVKFEHQNYIWDIERSSADVQNKPSNIDIALFDGYDEESFSDSKNVLFLESKFYEPLSGGICKDIQGRKYKWIYTELRDELKNMGFTLPDKIDDNKFTMGYDKRFAKAPYCSGIKQMISHFMGAVTFAKNYKGKVYLGTILYKFDDYRNDNPYPDLYSILAKKLNKIVKANKELKNKLEVIEQPFYYQDVFKNYNLDPNVKAFYSL